MQDTGGKSTTIRLKHFPKVIHDSIQATTQLGLDYLWVDKFCIDQEDENLKHETIMKMDRIYAAAEITIVAAAGSNSDDGLPGVACSARSPLKSIKISNSLAVVQIKHAEDCIKESVWATRAWTLQEGLLARRRLVFTSEQVFFECQEMQLAETLEVPLDILHKSHYTSRSEGGYFHAMANHHDLYNRLLWIFHNYTRRSLSYDTDRLNAFQGILNSMRPTMSHVWGLTFSVGSNAKRDFIHSLGWYHDWKWLKEKKDSLNQQPTFPSWSWAAWGGPQDYGCLAYTEDVQVKFHMVDGSTIDLGTGTLKDHLQDLEQRATHRLTLQTYVLDPDNLIIRYDRLRFCSISLYEQSQLLGNACHVQHYLGIKENKAVLENIQDGTFKLLFLGCVLHASKMEPEGRFIIGRNRGSVLERVGLMMVQLEMPSYHQVPSYLSLHTKYETFDLV
jgi:hypothetical protein